MLRRLFKGRYFFEKLFWRVRNPIIGVYNIIARPSLFGASLLTPMMLILFPYWIRFSSSGSLWEVVAWILLFAYPVCLILLIVELFRNRLICSFIYSIPFILALTFTVLPKFGTTLFAKGFWLYRICHQTEFSHCTLVEFSNSSQQSLVGPCLQFSNPNIPGFSDEKDVIMYDSSGLIAEPVDQHTMPWEKAVDQYVDIFGYADYYATKIGDNYFYVSFDMRSYGPAFRSSF